MDERLEQIVITRVPTGQIKLSEMGEGKTHQTTTITDIDNVMRLLKFLIARLQPPHE